MGFLKKLFGFGKKEEEKVDEEVNNEPTQTRNFKYLDDLIHSGVKEIILDSDIVLDDGEESNYKEGIKLDVDDLIIDGSGYAISAERKTRIFYCTGKNITIKNITLKNGHAEDGGAIYNGKEGRLTVSGSTLTGNTAEVSGGAIHNHHGTLTVSGSTLTGNTAEVSGGAICNMDGTLTVSGSTLTGNTAEVSGGAIYNWYGTLTVSGSTLTENTAKEDRGGVIYHEKGNFKVFNCDFSNNKSPKSIIMNMDSLQFFNSNFMSNHAPNIIVNDGDLTNVGIFNGEFKDNNIDESIIFNNANHVPLKKLFLKNIILTP